MPRSEGTHAGETAPPSILQETQPAGGAPEIVSPERALGATLLDTRRCDFAVWAPEQARIDLHIVHPRERRIALERDPRGYFSAIVDDAPAGARYFFTVNGTDWPDPASRL